MQSLLDELARVEALAGGSKLRRLLADPVRYTLALAFAKIIYPATHTGLLRETRTFFGTPMQVVLPASLDIYLTGGKTHDSEIRLARMLIRQLKEGDCFVDIGAHFGYFSLLASRLVGSGGRVLAFEASAGTFQLLRRNSRRESNVSVFHRAVSDRPEEIVFHEFPILYSEYNTMSPEQYAREEWFARYNPKKIKLSAMPLDELLRGWPRPALIKIDVEGAEEKVIRGAAQTLKEKPILVMEYLEPSRGNDAHRAAAELLHQAGYQAHHIDASGELAVLTDIEAYLEKKGLESDNIAFVA